MKKLNNKGFAISTLIYGLMLVAFVVVALLMSIMSTNRKNTSTLIKKIEEELNRYSQTATEITSTDGAQEFIVPYGQAGWYKIELWGAGAYTPGGAGENSRKGAYTSGIIYLEENTHLYFYIGTTGTSSAAATKNNIDTPYAGGSTDVRLTSNDWNESDSLNSRIMVAAGGGYNSSYPGGGFNSIDNHYKYDNDGGSYISGFAGQAIYSEAMTFLNTIMYSGVNNGAGKAKIELISTNGKTNPPSKEKIHLSNVKYIRDCIQIETTLSGKEHWKEIQAIDMTGKNIASGKTVKFGDYGSESTLVSGTTDNSLKSNNGTITSSATGYKCVVVELDSSTALEEIAIFHELPSSKTYSKELIEISSNGTNYTTIKKWDNTNNAPVETYMGIRFSDRSPEISDLNTKVIPTGNYYIQSAMSDNRVVTAEASIKLSLFTGDNNQKFSLTNVGTTSYKILESSELKGILSPTGTLEKCDYTGFEHWTIEPVVNTNNGYYMIKTSTNQCLTSGANERDKDSLIKLTSCDHAGADKKQWFKLVNADY